MSAASGRERFDARYGVEQESWVGGNASAVSLKLRRAHLFGGAELQFAASGVTAIVGANNVGKSTLLREIVNVLHRDPQIGAGTSAGLIVDRLELDGAGTVADLFAWLAEHSHVREVDNAHLGFARMGSMPVHPLNVLRQWQPEMGSLGEAAQFFAHYADGTSRLTTAVSVEMRDDASTPASHPVHRLEDDPELFEAFDGISFEVFRKHLELDRSARFIRLRVGRLDMEAPPVNAVTPAYRAAMAELPVLDSQGDGMRSLLGLVLPLVTSEFPIVVIDEPEAFLHPPQAQALGRILGRMTVERGIQVVLATHDKNLLAGLLTSGAGVTVARLRRERDVPFIAQLDTDILKELWGDPSLKHTNVLDGLFHRLVVLCEADGDCQYYASTLDVRTTEAQVPGSEILFAPTNGKAAMAKVARMLRVVDVPVVCSLDLDFLDDPTIVKNLVAAMGGDWAELVGLYRDAVANFAGADSGVTCEQVLDGVESVLRPLGATPYDAAAKESVRVQLRASAGPWERVKVSGVSAFTGTAWTAADELIRRLDSLGIVLVKEGVLERLAPEVAVRKGPAWLVAALDTGTPGNALSQAHLERLLTSGPAVAAADSSAGARL